MVSHTLGNTEEKMRKSIEALKKDLATLRTGHARPTLIEHIKVEYAGVPTPLNQIAGISAPEARLLLIQPWDRKALSNIEKAILKSDLGLNPANDGNVIRLRIPQLTEERREELIRMVRRRVEDGKVAQRNIRRSALEEIRELEREKAISQDQKERAQERLQKLTDIFIEKVDEVGGDKETELLGV